MVTSELLLARGAGWPMAVHSMRHALPQMAANLDLEAPCCWSSRRAVLLGSLATATTLSPVDAAVIDEDDSIIEERIFQALESSGTPPDVAIRTLEARGGSQRDQTEGIGAYGSWIGSWEVLYAAGELAPQPTLTDARGVRLALVESRQFVYGPPNAREELKGVGRDGGVSTESLYVSADGATRLLLVRSGSLVKLPDQAYRLELSLSPRTYRLPPATGVERQPAADAGEVIEERLVPAASGTDGARGSSAASLLCDFSYLSERLWISRCGDERALTVLRRSDARALAPPSARPDLTAPCSDTGWGPTMCRRQALF